MPLGGISGGTQPILSFNYGAYRRVRARTAARRSTSSLLVPGVHGGHVRCVARLAGPLFVRLFTTDDALVAEKAALGHPAYARWRCVPLGLQYEIVDGFTALGLAKLALPLSLWRKAVYFAAVFALPAFFGADAVFYAEPISDVLGPLASVAVYCVCIRGVWPHARRWRRLKQKMGL